MKGFEVTRARYLVQEVQPFALKSWGRAGTCSVLDSRPCHGMKIHRSDDSEIHWHDCGQRFVYLCFTPYCSTQSRPQLQGSQQIHSHCIQHVRCHHSTLSNTQQHYHVSIISSSPRNKYIWATTCDYISLSAAHHINQEKPYSLCTQR